MTQNEVVDHISEAAGITKKQARTVVDTLVNLLHDGVMGDNQRVPLGNMGTFKRATKNGRPAKVGRNPKTGEPINIPARPEKQVLRFLPAPEFR